MKPVWIYGVILNGTFHSANGNVEIKASKPQPDGIYKFDVTNSSHIDGVLPADIEGFKEQVKQSKKTFFLSGVVFKNHFTPFNYIKWQKKFNAMPIKVSNMLADDWELVQVFIIPFKKVFIYMDTLYHGDLFMSLKSAQDAFESNLPLTGISSLAPEMKILYGLHRIEQIRIKKEELRLERAELEKTLDYRIKRAIEDAGGAYISHRPVRGTGYEITWAMMGETINSLVREDMSMIEVGFCVSGYDSTQSLRSAVNLLQDYKDDGHYIHKTRGR